MSENQKVDEYLQETVKYVDLSDIEDSEMNTVIINKLVNIFKFKNNINETNKYQKEGEEDLHGISDDENVSDIEKVQADIKCLFKAIGRKLKDSDIGDKHDKDLQEIIQSVDLSTIDINATVKNIKYGYKKRGLKSLLKDISFKPKIPNVDLRNKSDIHEIPKVEVDLNGLSVQNLDNLEEFQGSSDYIVINPVDVLISTVKKL